MILNFIRKKIAKELIIIISIFLIDRISKTYVVFLSEKFANTELFSSSFLNINLFWNSGIAFGLLSFSDNFYYNFITVIIVFIIIILFYLSTKSANLQKYSYLIIIGGALGNLYDRIVFKSVPDFIDLHYAEFHWFIFNMADIFITLGIICLIYDELLLQKKDND